MTNLPSTARAAVFRAVRQPMSLECYPLPSLGQGEALARIRCATVCGSDLHSYFGRRHSPSPSVLGHEMVAEIADMGPGGVSDFRGRPLACGDRVTWSMVWSCGDCFFCSRGVRPKCEGLMKFGHEVIAPGREFLGGLAEYCLLPERTAIFRVPDAVPDLVASPANCATATVAAVLRAAGTCRDKAVVIHGAGMLGLTACAMAASDGAAQVIALEPNPLRRQLAAKFGATASIDATTPAEAIRQQVLDLTSGRGADIAMEFSGYPEAVELGVQLLRDGGRFVLAGATFPSRPLQLSADQIVRRLWQIIGVYNYAPEDLEAALEFLARQHNRYPFAQLVGGTFSLDEVNEAFDYAERERPPRVAILPSAPPAP